MPNAFSLIFGFLLGIIAVLTYHKIVLYTNSSPSKVTRLSNSFRRSSNPHFYHKVKHNKVFDKVLPNTSALDSEQVATTHSFAQTKVKESSTNKTPAVEASQNRTLVVLLGGLRGNNQVWQSLCTHLLDIPRNNADLALMLSESSRSSSSSLYKKAKYVWEVPEPKHNNWEAAIDSFFGKRTGKRLHSLTTVTGPTSWSGPIQWFFRAMALRHITKEKGLLDTYNRFIFTRTDFYYACDVDLTSFDLDFLWIPMGQDWRGINDRMMVVPRVDLHRAFNIIATTRRKPEKFKQSTFAFNDKHNQHLNPEVSYSYRKL